jgi:hypothetical protein
MDLSANWVPQLNGNNLAPFEALQEIEANDLVPDFEKEPSWAKGTVLKSLANVPKGRDAIWGSVLAVWRLRRLEGRLEDASEGFAMLWEEYLTAWVVSSVDSDGVGCRSLIREGRSFVTAP